MRYEPKTQPYGHQTTALRQAWGRRGFGFLMEMGTGKSKVIVDEIGAAHEAGLVDIAVIFAPKGVYSNWVRKEIPTHMPDRLRDAAIVHLWQGGGTAREKEALRRLMTPRAGLRILVVNTEAISASTRALETVMDFVRSGERCYAAVDEASTIKNPTARRTKNLLKIARMPQVTMRRIATGSPVPRGPLDLFSQFEFLEPACLGYRSFFGFRGTYAVVQKKEFGGRSVDVVVAYRNIEELGQRIARHAYVVKKEDCLDLPEKVYTTRDVELTDEQQRMYTEVRDWATTEIDAGRFVTATAVITQLLRLHQIVCGHVTDELGEVHDVPTRRIDVLEEVVAETSGKIIIWCQYRRDVARVVAAMRAAGRRVVEYHGGTTPEDRTLAIWKMQGEGQPTDPLWRWGADGRVPEEDQADTFVGTPSAGGYGITLTEASTVIYYSNGYDLEKRAQSEDRAHRIGQRRSVTYIDLVARGTVDEKIIAALEKKQSIADMIMRSPEDLRRLFTD